MIDPFWQRNQYYFLADTRDQTSFFNLLEEQKHDTACWLALMPRIDQIEGISDSVPGTDEHSDGMAVVFPASTFDRNRHDLIPILAVIRREMDQSATILRDLAGCLSLELCTLGTAEEKDTLRSSLLAATIALQNEDRVQQRLRDLGEVLSVLEYFLSKNVTSISCDVNQAIIESLRLEEMRSAFAIGVGMVDDLPQSSSTAEPPSIGDVDLF